MRPGRTSATFFISKLIASFFGFISTIYFARVLGADILGIYYIVIALVSWLSIPGRIGVTTAVTKRVSEGEEQGQYALAGTVMSLLFSSIISSFIFIFRDYVNGYIGYPAAEYLIILLLLFVAKSTIAAILSGVHMVHIRGVLSPVGIAARAVLQLAFVFASTGVVGLFLGSIGGSIIVLLFGFKFVVRSLEKFSIPEMRHFYSLFDYAKFSWLSKLQGKMFNYTDVIVLAYFVSNSLVGVYSVSWNISQLVFFSATAISKTFFPEISKMSSNKKTENISEVVEATLSYAGLLLIPGLIGGILLREPLLRIYGAEFPRGSNILVIMLFANLVMGYQKQFLNTLNAVDRPDLSFRINSVFVTANIVLNIGLVYLYGWIGAAVATALSSLIGLLLGYYYLNSILDFNLPHDELAHQWLAALLMGAVLSTGIWIKNTYTLVANNLLLVAIFVLIGTITYFAILFAISPNFRRTVSVNF